MKSGDVAYIVRDWQKRAAKGQDPILALKIYVIHEDHAKVAGKFLRCDQDFFLDRDVAVRRLRELVFRALKSLERRCVNQREMMQDALAKEELRLKQLDQQQST